MSRNFISLINLYIRSVRALKYAERRGLTGTEFGNFGRMLGRRLLVKGLPGRKDYLLNPVHSTRYFEFPFALDCLPASPRLCLDVSSPRLFSLYVAKKYPSTSILMINPDQDDVRRTMSSIHCLGLQNINVKNCLIDNLSTSDQRYDCIWAISVIEHISGAYDDQYAIKVMYDSLAVGGRLILTVPVDRTFWNEYRDQDYYGTQPINNDNNKYFFQRFYDKHAIMERLVSQVGKQPTKIRWFGEVSAGLFSDYVQQSIQHDYLVTVEDPKEIVDNYQEYESWEEMPGIGVCGLMFEKGVD